MKNVDSKVVDNAAAMQTQLHSADSACVIRELRKHISVSESEAEQIRSATLGSFLIVASKIWHAVDGRGTVPVFPIPFATIQKYRAARRGKS